MCESLRGHGQSLAKRLALCHQEAARLPVTFVDASPLVLAQILAVPWESGGGFPATIYLISFIYTVRQAAA